MTLKRFLNYIKFDTQSDPKSTTVPSSSKQRLLGEYLVKELKELGLTNAYLDDYGYVYGKIKGNNDKAKKIGFISHMDTAYDFSGKGVKARVIENYDGKDIVLNDNLVTKVSTFPF